MKGDNMKKKRNKLDPIGNFVRYGSFSAKWTAFFALIAVFSVMVLGITQVSFAAEDWPTELSNVTMDPEAQFEYNAAQYGIPNGGVKPKYAEANGKTIPVYCLEIWQHFAGSGESYVKSDSQDYMSPGVVALLTYANSSNGPFGKNLADDVQNTKEQQAVVQIALWAYLYKYVPGYKDNFSNSGSIGDGGYYMSDDSIELFMGEGSSFRYAQQIRDLVNFAVNNAQNYENPTSKFSGSNGEWQVDGDYVVSPDYTFEITPSGNLSTFTLSLSEDAPEGTKVIFDGQEYDANTLASTPFGPEKLNKTIKVKVPKDKITNESKTFKLNVSSTHTYYNGWAYSKSDNPTKAQKIAAGNVQPKTAESSVDITAIYKVDVPKTAQNSSVMLYIVGLIVLLSGVGVIYVNVKPAKQK